MLFIWFSFQIYGGILERKQMRCHKLDLYNAFFATFEIS